MIFLFVPSGLGSVIAGLKGAKNRAGRVLGPSQIHLALSFERISPTCRDENLVANFIRRPFGIHRPLNTLKDAKTREQAFLFRTFGVFRGQSSYPCYPRLPRRSLGEGGLSVVTPQSYGLFPPSREATAGKDATCGAVLLT